MGNLIKAELYRVFKDKLFLILCIIAGAMSLFLALMYFGLGSLLIEDGVTIREVFSAASLALSSFSPFSNFGLVVAIFLCILLGKDYTQGTVRNKIIMGKSRAEIFFSNLIVTVIIIMIVVVGFAILNFAISSIFFNTGITTDNIVSFLSQFALQILGWLVLATAIAFYSAAMKNAGVTIVTYIGIGLFLTIVGPVIAGVAGVVTSPDGGYENLKWLFDLITNINIPFIMGSLLTGNASLVSMLGDTSVVSELPVEFYCEYIGSCVAFSTLFVGLGYLAFNKKDIK
jgi:ABC-type transport system involved in multi-copper enzyme maturation permease subunit